MANSATMINEDMTSAGIDNFPSLDGKGYNTSFVTGFEVFDNGDPEKVRIAKDFLRYFMSSEELMNYAQIGIPASNATAERVSRHIFMQEAYTANMANTVDFTANNPNWRGVRDIFYIHIHELLAGTITPQEAARRLMRIATRRLMRAGQTVSCTNKQEVQNGLPHSVTAPVLFRSVFKWFRVLPDPASERSAAELHRRFSCGSSVRAQRC